MQLSVEKEHLEKLSSVAEARALENGSTETLDFEYNWDDDGPTVEFENGSFFVYGGTDLGYQDFEFKIELDTAIDVINYYEEESFKVCEVCGKKGRLRGHGWMATLCDECSRKKDEDAD